VEGWPTAVTVTPVFTPANLFGCDINLETTQTQGTIEFDPGTGLYRIAGSGGDIPLTEDHCFFASQWVKGDFQITARIVDRPSRAKAKAGVMLRESLDGPSRMAFLAGTGSIGVTLQYRRTTSGAATSPDKPVVPAKRFQPPLFLRLVRRGNTITSFISADGTAFSPVGKPQRFAPPLAESLYVGYAITAQRAGLVARNLVSHLTIGPAPTR
jgi:hypothetical protein